ncbi:hypothetical protein DRN63_03590 [Nanoarchaeota archaeon]|nr:MAG: hypothetical protein DRN63_03590 [Nanoarchaeota archaeon]
MHRNLRDNGILRKALEDYEVMFHLAADPEVRRNSVNLEAHYRQSMGTYSDYLRKCGGSISDTMAGKRLG